jgi:pimeloyl-ACP methyl ester carboxylesterase
MSHRSTLYFSHGKESGPWGTKISYLADIATQLGHDVQSIDYRASMDPDWRVQHLLDAASSTRGDCILVGSSMGAYVATVASQQLEPHGLFLLAPAFYLPGYEQQTPAAPQCPVTIVHGWHDEVVPVDNAIRYAREHDCAFHVINSDHGLNDSLYTLGKLLGNFLQALSD